MPPTASRSWSARDDRAKDPAAAGAPEQNKRGANPPRRARQEASALAGAKPRSRALPIPALVAMIEPIVKSSWRPAACSRPWCEGRRRRGLLRPRATRCGSAAPGRPCAARSSARSGQRGAHPAARSPARRGTPAASADLARTETAIGRPSEPRQASSEWGSLSIARADLRHVDARPGPVLRRALRLRRLRQRCAVHVRLARAGLVRPDQHPLDVDRDRDPLVVVDVEQLPGEARASSAPRNRSQSSPIASCHSRGGSIGKLPFPWTSTNSGRSANPCSRAW